MVVPDAVLDVQMCVPIAYLFNFIQILGILGIKFTVYSVLFNIFGLPNILTTIKPQQPQSVPTWVPSNSLSLNAD